MSNLSKLKLYSNDIMVAGGILFLVVLITAMYFIRSIFTDSDIEYINGTISSLYEDRMFVVFSHENIQKSIIEIKIPHYLYRYYWEGAKVKLVRDNLVIKLIDPLTNKPLILDSNDR